MASILTSPKKATLLFLLIFVLILVLIVCNRGVAFSPGRVD